MNLKPTKRQLLDLLPDRIVQTRGTAQNHAIYLSFDDGPHPEYTPRLLDLLGVHGARASFFVIGQQAEKQPAIIERIVAEGHLLGNHSWKHDHFGRLPVREQLAEIARNDALLSQFDGHTQHRFRPPQGILPLSLLLSLARRRRSVVYWSYDSRDFRMPPAAAFVGQLRHQPPVAGDIVLMHDDNALAGVALAELLPEWRDRGHSFPPLAPEHA